MKLLVPPPLVAAISALLMWGIASQFDAARFAFPFQEVLAYALMGLGILIDIVSIVAFRRERTTVTPLAPEKASSLVVTGLYRFTRNPMYLGLLLVIGGIALLLGSFVNGAVIVAFVAYITAFQIKPEEDRLTEVFGARYLAYMQEVRRWI
jgi:protein-S-isoprenylcysteine O-methyltransferase Ste14